MKILVDKMPEEKYDCPYCRDKKNDMYFGSNYIGEKNYDFGICTWQDSDHCCLLDEISSCPYFAELKEKDYENN